MRRPNLSGLRTVFARRRPAVLLSGAAVVVAMAGGLTGVALAGGDDGDHGGFGPGHHAEHRDGPGDDR